MKKSLQIAWMKTVRKDVKINAFTIIWVVYQKRSHCTNCYKTFVRKKKKEVKKQVFSANRNKVIKRK